MDINNFIKNINEKRLAKTIFGKSIYSNLWYVNIDKKICITFTPRAGCSISFQQFLDLSGLLKDALQYSLFVHDYRCKILDNNIPYIPIQCLLKEKYIFIKFIMNPYIRAVSIYRSQMSHNLSFREYMKQLVNNKISYFTDNDKYHNHLQYIDGEEKIITKYIKINENEKYDIKIDDEFYEIDVNKYTSLHHGTKYDINEFCGDISRTIINDKLPKNYKLFYDEEIKNLVYNFYKKDIIKYNFDFNF